MPINATQPIEINPTTVKFCIRLLGVSTTTVAEGAMRLLGLYTTLVILNTTICGMSNLCIVKCCCLFDLLFDESKCVHCTERVRVNKLPFLQSFASHLQSGVASLMVSITSVRITLFTLSFASIRLIISTASIQAIEE